MVCEHEYVNSPPKYRVCCATESWYIPAKNIVNRIDKKIHQDWHLNGNLVWKMAAMLWSQSNTEFI